MSVLMREMLFRGAAAMVEDDVSVNGGAIDWTKKISFVDISPTGTLDYVSSSGSDTGVKIQAFGRDSTGTIQSELKTLTGTAPVLGSQQFERLMKAYASASGGVGGTVAVGDVAVYAHTAILSSRTAQTGANFSGTTDASITLQSGDGASCAIGDILRMKNNTPSGVQNQLREVIALSGDVAYVNADWSTVPSSSSTYDVYQGMLFNLAYGSVGGTIAAYQVKEIRRPFYNAASDVAGGSTRNYYDKIFAVNIDTLTALTVSSIVKQADPASGTINFALETNGTVATATYGLNGTGVIATRQTAPSQVTAFSSGAAPQTINLVNSNQSLPNGASPNAGGAQGIWLQLQLTAGLAPAKTSFTLREAGQTT